jgi:hypothetical protein
VRNCFTYAVGKWRREGGYIVLRRSLAFELFEAWRRPWWHPHRLTWLVPHALHRGYDGRITQYVPTPEQVTAHRACPLRFWVSLWHFEGRVVEGDHVCEQLRAAMQMARDQ